MKLYNEEEKKKEMKVGRQKEANEQENIKV